MALDVICAKKYSLPLIIKNLRWHKTHNKDVGIVAFDLIGLLSTNHIFILQWHSGVNEEMFDVNIKIAQTTQHSWEFIVRNSSLLNFGDYPGDFILWSGDREIWSKSGISQITQESGNCEEELPKKPVGRLSVNRRPTHYRQLTDRLPTVSQRRKLLRKHALNMT